MREALTLMIQSQQVTPDHLLEFREEVEGAVTALAARRATAKDAHQLRSLLAEAAACLTSTPVAADAFLKTDLKIHILLARITRNPIYVAVLKMVHENILDIYDQYSLQEDSALRTMLQDLTAIVEAVAGGHSAEARRLAGEHVRWFYRYKQGQGTPAD